MFRGLTTRPRQLLVAFGIIFLDGAATPPWQGHQQAHQPSQRKQSAIADH